MSSLNADGNTPGNNIAAASLRPDAMRVETMRQACVSLGRTQGLFLFADTSILSGDILSNIWQTGRPGETGGLLD